MPYSSFLGTRVEVHYRASDLQLCAVGKLVSDSSHAIVLEERFQQNGREKLLRVEIPYEYILRVAQAAEKPAAARSTYSLTSK
jgi:hypothetical protein